MRRDSTADADVGELTDESPAPQFIEYERTQMFARRYEDPAVTVDRWFEELPTVNVRRQQNVHVVPRTRLAMGTDRQAPVPQRRAPTPSELDASYAAVLRALR